ncbi:TauD/TfdA dioxygenase family protein [Leeia sp.]|uniref:TauD/TfdA dioxygenase family protein n=1 Tax=Leeia sp. TaxID=2884678 RepID=UPI0035B100DE
MSHYVREAVERITTRKLAPYETIKVEPITPIIGAEISGVDLTRELTAQQIAEIRRAWLEHHVVVFRKQELSAEDQKRVARYFGELRQFPIAKFDGGDPEIVEARSGRDNEHIVGGLWHTDGTGDEAPSAGSFLYMMDMPEVQGGDTMFSNMHLAYDMMSPAMKAFLEGLTAHHDGIVAWRGHKPPEGFPIARADHPVVMTHPENGRKNLFVNSGFTTKINELAPFESQQLLQMLYRMIEQEPILACRIRWEKHAMVWWDNRCTQHFAVWDYYPYNRHVRRVTINGSKPTL